MRDDIGPKTQTLLERGLPRFRGGQAYARRAKISAEQGFKPPMQLIVDRAEGDFVYDLETSVYSFEVTVSGKSPIRVTGN